MSTQSELVQSEVLKSDNYEAEVIKSDLGDRKVTLKEGKKHERT